ncbi:hypothetical protein CFP56_009449 [Quercus suber]|uniref:Uncharacterized protein n=1 Tax=Quercus suber TaxID=58331 RepID=A0AAW0L1Z9_QUESU
MLIWKARDVGDRRKNVAVIEGPRVKAKWLEDRFSNPLPADATEQLVQQYAQFYILEMLGEDSQADWRCIAIGAVVGVGEVSTHMSCDEASTLGTARRWKGAKITTEHGMHILRAYRVSLASLRPN